MTNPFILPTFQNTIYKTEAWLAKIMNLLDWNAPKGADEALRAVLHTLCDGQTGEDRQIIPESFAKEES